MELAETKNQNDPLQQKKVGHEISEVGSSKKEYQ